MKKIKIICVGGGWVTNTRHIPALKASGKFDIIGVVSRQPDRSQSTAEKHGLPDYSTELDFNVPWQAEADAIMIGTVPHVHAEIAKKALLAGKSVLTEKPMVLDPKEALELQEIATEKNLTLAVVHNFQFANCATKLKALMASGEFGNIQAVYGVQ
ncbi:MAG: Gfo/Idh/MocA family oxidoreductase, partial [Lentisphaerae bacterium]|nr:Gfo/Idh/MocA family oxidoreductase [Lentisphaerota bacterium]